jgi:phytoene desaturase
MAGEKVVIIGAGLAGLSAGCLLSGHGIDVAILEANGKPGGCCATTDCAGYTFNDGAVYVAAPQLLDAAFAKLDLDRDRLLPLRKVDPALSVTLPDGTTITVRETLHLQVEGRGVDASRMQEDLRQIMRKWKPVFDVAIGQLATEPFSPLRAFILAWRHLHKFRGSVASELGRLVSDARIRAALAGTMLHAGLPPGRMPAAAMLGLITVLADGLFLPAGGMGSIPGALVAALRARGAEIRLSCPVTRIIVAKGRTVGVETSAGEYLKAAAVISTVSPMSTFTALVDRTLVPASMSRRVRRARLSHRAVSLQFGLRNRPRTKALVNMVLPMLEHQHQVLAQDPCAVAWPVYSVPTMTLPELAPAGGSVVEMFVPVGEEVAVGKWQASKQELAESAIRALRRFHDVDVAVSRVRTPIDFHDEMHLYAGALYGLSPAVPPHQQFPRKTGIRGLFLAGQCTYPGCGVAPAMLSGIFAAQALIA